MWANDLSLPHMNFVYVIFAPQCQIIYTLLQVSSCEINLGINLLQVCNTNKSCCVVTVILD